MNSRERFYEITHYGKWDRIFNWEMGPFPETIERWQKEGLGEDMHWRDVVGMDRFERVTVDPGLCPLFKEEIISRDGEYEIYRDPNGITKKRHIDAPEPVMPQYLDYSLKGREQWPEFSKRLNPESPARFPLHWESLKYQFQDRDFPLGIFCGSLFGWIRIWMGLEGISYALYDDRAFVEQMVEETAECLYKITEKALVGIKYDWAFIWEDMAYKNGSLISPQLYREIFIPHYRRITDLLHGAGIDIITMDSDGNVDELIPCWLDIGINFIYPMEVAAGMDVVKLRKKFGKSLLIGGGIDKRILAKDKAGIKKMVDERIPLLKEGGYIPGVDHIIPPDVPWENFLYYRQLLNEALL